MRLMRWSLLFLLTLAAATASAQVTPEGSHCASTGAALMRTTLYFGLTRAGGRISERQWRGFLRDEVTPRFPAGFTVWEADGQWRSTNGKILRERSKVLLIVHGNSAEVRAALSALIGVYRARYDQESVLWEDAVVCAAF